MERTKTKIQTITITKIDTIIKIIPDTVTIKRYVTITDTAKIETKTANAKAYFSPIKNKIVLELKLKPFDVPVKLSKKVTENKKTNEVKRTKPYEWIISFFILIGLIFTGYYGFKEINKKLKE